MSRDFNREIIQAFVSMVDSVLYNNLKHVTATCRWEWMAMGLGLDTGGALRNEAEDR